MKRYKLDYASRADKCSDGIVAINRHNKNFFRKLQLFIAGSHAFNK